MSVLVQKMYPFSCHVNRFIDVFICEILNWTLSGQILPVYQDKVQIANSVCMLLGICCSTDS